MNNKTFNTGETQEELTQRYNPEGSPLRKCQLRMLDMLVYIDKICKEQGIEYIIAAGNVLGAVRHGGFIPWDDDTDIMMKRNDYRRFRDYLRSHPHPQFVLQEQESDPKCILPWNKLRDLKSEYIEDNVVLKSLKYRGVQIDIFSIEEGGTSWMHSLSFIPFGITYQFERHQMWRCANIINQIGVRLVYPILRFIGRFIGKGNCFLPYGSGWHFKMSYNHLFPSKPIMFEGVTLMGPNNPIENCKEWYGDGYTQLPPENARRTHADEYKVWD